MNRSSLPAGLSTLKKWKDEKDTLHFDLAYQRHQGMWGQIQKSMLVWSILADSYIPPIVLVKADEDKVDEKGKSMSVYSVLDGLQRLSNLFDFLDNKYQLHGSTPDVRKEHPEKNKKELSVLQKFVGYKNLLSEHNHANKSQS